MRRAGSIFSGPFSPPAVPVLFLLPCFSEKKTVLFYIGSAGLSSPPAEPVFNFFCQSFFFSFILLFCTFWCSSRAGIFFFFFFFFYLLLVLLSVKCFFSWSL
jgi:hypothetical protein